MQQAVCVGICEHVVWVSRGQKAQNMCVHFVCACAAKARMSEVDQHKHSMKPLPNRLLEELRMDWSALPLIPVMTAPAFHKGIQLARSLVCSLCLSDDSWPAAQQARIMCHCVLAVVFMQVWLVSRRHVAQLACVLTGMNVMYYSILWWFTGDMSTPIMAAFLHAAAEVWYGEQGQPRHGSSKAGGR